MFIEESLMCVQHHPVRECIHNVAKTTLVFDNGLTGTRSDTARFGNSLTTMAATRVISCSNLNVANLHLLKPSSRLVNPPLSLHITYLNDTSNINLDCSLLANINKYFTAAKNLNIWFFSSVFYI